MKWILKPKSKRREKDAPSKENYVVKGEKVSISVALPGRDRALVLREGDLVRSGPENEGP